MTLIFSFLRSNVLLPLLACMIVACSFCFPAVGLAQQKGSFTNSNGTTSVVVKRDRLSDLTVNLSPNDEIWFVNARESHLAPNDLSCVTVSQFVDGNWAPSDLVSLTSAHANDVSRSTIFYVHGNRTNEEWAKARGFLLYDNIFGANKNCRPPLRLVLFAWQSEQQLCNCTKEYIQKSKRSVAVGETFAHVLNQFPDRRMGIIGFSLGAQVTISALSHPTIQQDLNDSNLGNPNPSHSKGQYRLSLIAPSLDGCFSSDQYRRFPNSSAVARADIFNNRQDRALWAARVLRQKQARSGGITINTLYSRGNLPLRNANSLDMANSVGKKHSVDIYTSQPVIISSVNSILWEVKSELDSKSSNYPNTNNFDSPQIDYAIPSLPVEGIAEPFSTEPAFSAEPTFSGEPAFCGESILVEPTATAPKIN